MKRSKWKRIVISDNIRGNLITPFDIDSIKSVHNGKNWKEIKIISEHVGLKLGTLCHTKITPRYKKKVK